MSASNWKIPCPAETAKRAACAAATRGMTKFRGVAEEISNHLRGVLPYVISRCASCALGGLPLSTSSDSRPQARSWRTAAQLAQRLPEVWLQESEQPRKRRQIRWRKSAKTKGCLSSVKTVSTGVHTSPRRWFEIFPATPRNFVIPRVAAARAARLSVPNRPQLFRLPKKSRSTDKMPSLAQWSALSCRNPTMDFSPISLSIASWA